MNLPEIAIRRPVFSWMIGAALVVFGLISFVKLGVSQLPDVDSPVVSISCSLAGAAPETMESQVVDPIEDAVMQIEGIRSLASQTSQSSALLAVEFELGRNIDEALQEIENRLGQISNLLPSTMQPPSVRKSNPEDQPILWLSLTAADSSVQPIDLMIYARNYLSDVFATVPGVGQVVLGGYNDPALRVWIDQDALKKHELVGDDVVQAIIKEHLEMPVGRIENGDREFNVRLMGEAANPKDFGKIAINDRTVLGVNYRPTRIGEIGSVEESTVDVRRISRFDGKLAVGVGFLKQHGANAVEVARQVRRKLKEVQAGVPKRFRLEVRSDSTLFIEKAVHELYFMLILSALLTSIVCFLFLGSWTSTMNVLFAIPTSIIGAFTVFYLLGFTLNAFTLLGLTLAIGIVVDDAVMMLENIVRHRELGLNKLAAARKGSKEIEFAAMAATTAVAAIFLPVVFMTGVIGRYFYQFGITVTVAVLLSLLEALTLTPMRCSRYLAVPPMGQARGRVDRWLARLAHAYRNALSFLLKTRTRQWGTMLATVGLFLCGFRLAQDLPRELLPAQDQSQMLIRLKLPTATALPVTDEKSRWIEAYLAKRPEVKGYYSAVGGFGSDAVNQSMLYVTLVDPNKRSSSQAQLIDEFRSDLQRLVPGVNVVIQDLSLRGFGAGRGFPIEFAVQGPDWNTLTLQTRNLIAKLNATGLVTDVNTDVNTNADASGVPEYGVIPDRAKMAARGVSVEAVTNELNELIGGVTLNGATEYAKDGHRYEIEVRSRPDQRDRRERLNGIYVRNHFGETVPLSRVTTLIEQPAIESILRLNRERAITVYANPSSGHSQMEALTTAQEIGKKFLPPGYFLKLTGSSRNFTESFQSLIFALILGVLISYMVLASQFNSFLHPLAVLMALPFSFTGAFIALRLDHQSINIYSLIGLILLMGIVKKNSILLVDFTNQVRGPEGTEGRTSVTAALLTACPVRMRPILMTSLATIAGALPEALSLGPGTETTIPMAVAIIGGVVASTVLTLFAVPCAYNLLSSLERRDRIRGEVH